jgi:hypothetical protein
VHVDATLRLFAPGDDPKAIVSYRRQAPLRAREALQSRRAVAACCRRNSGAPPRRRELLDRRNSNHYAGRYDWEELYRIIGERRYSERAAKFARCRQSGANYRVEYCSRSVGNASERHPNAG